MKQLEEEIFILHKKIIQIGQFEQNVLSLSTKNSHEIWFCNDNSQQHFSNTLKSPHFCQIKSKWDSPP